MTLKILAAAQAELMAAIDRYDAEKPGLGKEFAVEILESLDRIHDFPLAWPVFEEDIRRCLTDRFPYGILYAIEGETILVIAVMHQHREPGYWRDRQ